MGEVDVVAVETDRFPDPQPGTGQQLDQHLERRRPQRRAQPGSGGHHREDLLLAAEIRGRAGLVAGQQLEQRYFADGIERVQVAREPAHRSQPPRQVVGTAAAWQPRPFQRDPGGVVD